MSKYVESNLNRNETVIKECKRNAWRIVVWLAGAIVLIWTVAAPIMAILQTIFFFGQELAVTNKRVIGKATGFGGGNLDAPLNKIQSVNVSSPFIVGKIFNYGNITISTASDKFVFRGIKDAEAFKNTLMNQIEEYENDKIQEQAEQMAKAMAAASNNNN